MRQVEARDRSRFVSRSSDLLHIERLPGVIVNTAEKNKRERILVLPDCSDDILMSYTMLALARLYFDHRLIRIEPVKARLRLHRILVGRECFVFAKYPVALLCGAVKRDHQ
jgi:hypothetical protein